MALDKKVQRRNKIKRRIRKNVFGTQERPRMSVFRSNKHISVQVIDDVKGVTIASASSRCKEISSQENITKVAQAELVGKLIAAKAKEAGVESVVFDRNGYLYHGRVLTLANAAREAGLTI
ncbi:MAG: 50S ribosomal protein L18 [Bacteroidales bacterium]|nr:50S ribosomal protein L18 [Bacteroidales bacterium]